jgi:hypothetical protein
MEAALNSRSLEATEVPPNFNTIKDTCYRSSDFEAEAGRAPGGSRPANGSLSVYEALCGPDIPPLLYCIEPTEKSKQFFWPWQKDMRLAGFCASVSKTVERWRLL